MKVALKLVGQILLAIATVSLVSLCILSFYLMSANPTYNYFDYAGFRVPDWAFLLAFSLGIAGGIVVNVGKYRESHRAPS